MECDLLIIGGGASGLSAAITAARLCPKAKIIIAEKNKRVGKKLAVTGNGRCNISNSDLDACHYHGDRDFAAKALKNFSFDDTVEFFDSLGVIIKTEDDGRAYPYCLQAASVVDALRFECDRLKIITLTEFEITGIKHSNNKFYCSGADKITAKSVIFAAGGCAGGSLYGTDGSAYSLLNGVHIVIEPKPVIVQLKTENSVTKRLKGIKINADVDIGGHSCYGEVLFCDYGLSGPAVMQLSRYAQAGSTVSLDIMPEYSEAEVHELLKKRLTLNRQDDEFFTGLLNKRLGQTIAAICGGVKNLPLLAKTIKSLEFKVTGNMGFKNAQATAGGIDTNEFELNMSSKKIPGLFCCGEALNVDGDCGGYNLQWAFCSAFIAAKAASEFLLIK